ncbi:hypothetical protein L596_022096 [Steinernema carpocapsae]|uniref:Uncharacterized protein n=1 Tax=Steinernema carpocapsae TaxID=34508 RepID=A0A4U5MKT3_STECR|nr:hypothetical protein L596_022096 [Steinernema carpocapsae]
MKTHLLRIKILLTNLNRSDTGLVFSHGHTERLLTRNWRALEKGALEKCLETQPRGGELLFTSKRFYFTIRWTGSL